MKNVPQLRFAGFDEEWEVVKFETLANIVRGASPRPIADDRWFDESSDVGWLRISDVTNQNGRIHELEQKLSLDGQAKTRVYKTPHLILSIAASVGKPVINYINTGVHDGFLIFEDPIFNLEFMFQFLDKIQLSWSKYGQPGSQVNLNSDIVKNRKIYLPTLDEQNKNGELFRKIDALIEKQEGKVSKMEDFKKSMLQKMFPKKGELIPEFRFSGFHGNYEGVYLTNIGENLKGSIYSKKDTEENNGNSEFIHYGMIFTEYSSIITESSYKVIEKPNSVKSKVGDLIMPASSTTSDNEIVSASAIGKEGIIYGSDINIIRTNDIDLALYLSYYITGTELKNLIFKNVQGTTIHHLYFSSLENITVLLPSTEEQRTINRFFRNIEKEIAVEEKLLESYKQMKKSLLQKMFV